MLNPEHRIAVLLHDGVRGTHGKTGLSLLRYRQSQIVAVVDRQCAGQSIRQLTQIPCDAPIVGSVAESLAYQPDVLAIGIAPPGGQLPEAWLEEVRQAVQAGLCVANGLHTPLNKDLAIQQALGPRQWVWDMRQEPPGLKIGSALARSLSCLRVLAVGTDMSVGKMSASLELNQAAHKRGMKSKFLATGQAGLMIAGEGIPLDAIRVDFAAGAVEGMVMGLSGGQEIVFVEGQGSLLHPGSTATLPLIRGSQPTHLILVHRAGQAHIRNHPQVPIPPLPEVIQLYEAVAQAAGSFAETKVCGIALNTVHLTPEEAEMAIAQTQAQTGLPCTDVVRYGADLLLDAILRSSP